MAAQLVVIVVVIAFDGCVLDRAVHSFDLAVGPGMIDLGESVFDTVLAATQSEHVRHISRVRRICLSRWQTELAAIIGNTRRGFVGNVFHQGDQEGRCCNTIGFFGKLDEGELRSSVDRHEEVELSLGGLHFGDVDVEEADRIRLELFLCRLVAFDLSKTADPMPLQTTMHDERVRCGIVGWSAYKQSSSGRSVCRRKPTMTASSSIDSTVDRGSFGLVRRVHDRAARLPLAHRLLIDAVTSGERSQALFTMLYRSTDRLSRRGAPVKNLAHSASFDSCNKNAP